MPISSTAATIEKKRASLLQNQTKSIDKNDERSDAFLTIESALPFGDRRKLYKRSHSTLNASTLIKASSTSLLCDPVTIETKPDGSLHITRAENEKETHPDRISLDRRGLTSFPIIDGEIKLRLLSLQHNLISNLGGLKTQIFPYLVFLDIYDNQLDHLSFLDKLENLRVLLVGKNRIRKIEGLNLLKKIEVLDLHGNQITHVSGLTTLTELKVLNLAGNQIRYVGTMDFQGLHSLQELNLRRNKLKKLLGFGETTNLTKLFISNNDLQSVEDISSLAKSSNLKEVSIDNNPVFLSGDCVSFLVSYLPQLFKLNTMQITEQVRKVAMAWRRNKESTNSSFMDLTSDVCLNVRREEIISNARTNWELLRSQTKCLTAKSTPANVGKALKNLNLEGDLILTSFGKSEPSSVKHKSKPFSSITTKVPPFLNKKLLRSNSQDTDNSQNTSSSNTSSNEFIRLPPILVPIIKRMEHRGEGSSKENSVKLSGSLSSIGPNVDSSVSSLGSENESSSCSESDSESENEEVTQKVEEKPAVVEERVSTVEIVSDLKDSGVDTTSVASTNTVVSNVTLPSTSSADPPSKHTRHTRNIKSAVNSHLPNSKWQVRASTAKPKKQSSPSVSSGGKDREQGGDYLIEICGRYLNVYGQCALRFIDKSWNASKANDVTTVRFNYVNFNSVAGILNKLKHRFPNVDHFIFKETNIYCLGQLNALSEVQGLTSLYIDPEGNPVVQKKWESYAIYRLSHWGLSKINDKEVCEDDIKRANAEYQSLTDLVLWSLPEMLLQPLLIRLRLDVSHAVSEQNAKKWLLSADPELRNVVSKEALQWKKGSGVQDDPSLRQKAKSYMCQLVDEMGNSVNKLRILDKRWPAILQEFVTNTLLDYSQLDMYMKQKVLELMK